MSLFAPGSDGHKPLTLRPYQVEAVEAVYRHLRERDDNPCVVIPTGGGKTPVIATICRDAVQCWNGRVLILAHVKELLEQARDKLDHVCPDLHVGIYSAGLNRRDTTHSVIIAGIQSVYQKAEQLGHFDLVIVDEAHMIPPGRDGDGMYRHCLADMQGINPHLRVIGLTATPFRMSSGPICVPPPEGILNSICYEIGVRELIRDSYLSPLRSKSGRYKPDFQSLHVRAGEFVSDEVEQLMDQDSLVQSACREVVDAVRTGGRRACLVFASGVEHGKHVTRAIEQISKGTSGGECGFIDGQTPMLNRDEMIRRFRAGELTYLVNVNVLTTGFDAPNVDCVALLRPTLSPGLYYQMVGRGFRLCEGKTDCLVLDFGGNVLRHGPVDAIRIVEAPGKGSGDAPAKECPQCQALIASGYATCPECGHVFPPPERRTHDATADSAGILSGQVAVSEHQVRRVYYSVHVKRDAPPDAPRSMRVDYDVGFYDTRSEWICLEHDGYARQKAEAWWRARSELPVPDNVEEAAELAHAGALADVRSIKVRSVAGEKYDRIVDYELGPKPDPADLSLPEPSHVPEYAPLPGADDDIPF
ncbi:MAG: DEAD/DEAH box helicase family protein [Phycisphaeraceae bacterium]|nr:DEAD/DEAH box helicase family protein [Phycisphaeraceae bacterium]